MANVIINDTNLTAIADAIRAKNGTTNTYKPSEMATAISAITTGDGTVIPDIVINGNCDNLFANNRFASLINACTDEFTAEDITGATSMFANSDELTNVSFVVSFGEALDSATDRPNYMFKQCYNLRNVGGIESTKGATVSFVEAFYQCYSLRSISTINLDGTIVSFNKAFYDCECLDEILDLPTSASIDYNNAFTNCFRLKRLTFALKSDGTPRTASWNGKVIDLTSVGFLYDPNGYWTDARPAHILSYNSGITADKQMEKNYQALQDDPDGWTRKKMFGRYGHDSAVETINSLPDTSAKGTNTIKFTAGAGSALTNGGVDDLTEEEMAVATAKGWTVAYIDY